jgi:hypothetical protein
LHAIRVLREDHERIGALLEELAATGEPPSSSPSATTSIR